MFDLTGRVALVTGAAKGIGRRTAGMLSDAGAIVYFADVNDVAIDKGSTPSARALSLDVTSEQEWAAAVREISRNEDRLDILVNNAGIMTTRPFLELTLDDYRREHRVNAESVWIGMQACHPLLARSAKRTLGSSIVNLSSIYGQLAGPMVAAYSATKGAVRLLTKSVAVEFARMGSGIRVNSVHPGPVNTDLVRHVMQSAVDAGLIARTDDGMQATAALHPMGRMAETDDVAGAILFLASDASRFITGSELVVDGGYSIV